MTCALGAAACEQKVEKERRRRVLTLRACCHDSQGGACRLIAASNRTAGCWLYLAVAAADPRCMHARNDHAAGVWVIRIVSGG